MMKLLVVMAAALGIFLSHPLHAEIRAEVLNVEPFICCFYDFLSDAECDHLMKLAKSRLEPSKILDSPKDGVEQGGYSKARTSSSALLAWQEDEIVSKLEGRIAAIAGLPPENGENFQVLHYQSGQEYRPHYDWFLDDQPTLKRGGQRAVSVIIYLSEPEEGGETDFLKLNISIKPKIGMMLLFRNTKPNGERDYDTLHAGVPVKKGEKWIATKWIRYGDFQHSSVE
jgi:prolyl 4-hydroxylase